MALTDLDAILEPVSADAPCGIDLEAAGDAEFAELDAILAGIPAPLEPLDAVMLDGFLCGVIVGVVAMLGLSMLLGVFTRRLAAHGARRDLKGSQQESTDLRLDRDRLAHQLDHEHSGGSVDQSTDQPPLAEPPDVRQPGMHHAAP